LADNRGHPELSYHQQKENNMTETTSCEDAPSKFALFKAWMGSIIELVVRYSIFSILIGLLPLVVQWIGAMEQGTPWDQAGIRAVSGGELYLMAAIVAAGAIGQVIGIGKKQTIWEILVGGCLVVLLLFSAMRYSSLAPSSSADGGKTLTPDVAVTAQAQPTSDVAVTVQPQPDPDVAGDVQTQPDADAAVNRLPVYISILVYGLTAFFATLSVALSGMRSQN
jgi:hypothetical protein